MFTVDIINVIFYPVKQNIQKTRNFFLEIEKMVKIIYIVAKRTKKILP